MAALAELDTSLEALKALKAPGVTKSRIASITALCQENVKSESVLVQKIFTHFKKSPATHKLGVMYVVDSVVRQWIEKAGVTGQDVFNIAAPDGTFAAGVRRVTELLPTLMNDLIQSAPDDQKDKIFKLIDIWERGSIFPAKLLSEYKVKLINRPPQSPAPAPPAPTQQTAQAAPATVESMSAPMQQQAVNPIQFPALSLPNANHVATAAPNTQNASSILAGLALQQPPAPVITHNGMGMTSSMAPMPTLAPAAPALTPEQANALATVIPPHIANDPEALNQHLKILQQLAEMGVPADQWPLVIQALQEQKNLAPQAATGSAPPFPGVAPRARSRSPTNRRDSPVYGKYDGQTYRQRSPLRSGSPSLQADTIMFSNSPKWTDFDASLPQGCIKVLSRTLFVGGVACSEDELRRIFSRFGRVQTCIANGEKRHAFVKMCTRAEALAARDGMQVIKDNDVFSKIRSVRWGVGFGPRDCSDYATGISIIPIDRLTDADRKWVLTAEYGGTGGKPIATGIVMEEPDIEIGAGVSSKAISARRGGNTTGNENRRGRQDASPNSNSNSNARHRRADHQSHRSITDSDPPTLGSHNNTNNSNSNGGGGGRAKGAGSAMQPAMPMQGYGAPPGLGVSPAVPGFGFQIPGMTPPGYGGR